MTSQGHMNMKILSQRNGVLEVNLFQLQNSAGAVVTVREGCDSPPGQHPLIYQILKPWHQVFNSRLNF